MTLSVNVKCTMIYDKPIFEYKRQDAIQSSLFKIMKVFIALACLAAVASAGLVTKKSLAADCEDCPPSSISLLNLLPKKIAKTTCAPDEFECPVGCCPEAYFSFCCPDREDVDCPGCCGGVYDVDCKWSRIFSSEE